QLALFNQVEDGARFLFRRKLPCEDIDDMVHDLFATVVDQIRHGRVREPEHLLAYIRSIGRRMIAWRIKEFVIQRRALQISQVSVEDRRAAIDERLAQRETFLIMKQALRSLRDWDREILIRFYLKGQSKEEIC